MIFGERAGGNVEVEMAVDEVVVGLNLVAAVNIVEEDPAHFVPASLRHSIMFPDESVKVYG
jgi:hypothetical protein